MYRIAVLTGIACRAFAALAAGGPTAASDQGFHPSPAEILPPQLIVIAERGSAGDLLTLEEQLPGHLRPLLRHAPADPDLAEQLGLTRTYILEDLRDGELALASDLLAQSPHCEAFALDPTGTTHSFDEIPRDPYFPQQYALNNTGQRVGGQAGLPAADINILDAWMISHGSPKTVVAVFDAGVSESHPDLAHQLVPGWNFVTDSPDTDDDRTSHGTHCAGIIAANTANREGIAGIARDCRIMPVVVLNRYGFGNESTLAEALVWAADQGVPVASVSLGFNPTDGGADDRTLRAAVRYATAQGMLICASSGNVPTDRIGAPARYPETIAVGATDNRNLPWRSTSTGPELTVTAPGVDIVSTWDSATHGAGENTYDYSTGTSQACPHVAGIAALVHSINPGLTPGENREIIVRTSLDLGSLGWDEQYGAGRVDAAMAARAAADSHRGTTDGPTECRADFNQDRLVDTRDFIAYLMGFRAQHWRADMAEPYGVWDTRDLLAFLDDWAAGCPD